MHTFPSFWQFVIITLILCNLTLVSCEFSTKDVVYAVNCGGDYFKDSHGINYQSDESSSGIASDFGKQFLVFGRVSQSDSVLYQTEKYDTNTFGYDVPLDGDGDYVLVLKFSEVYFNSPGAKIFSVLLNERHTVISDLDIYEKVGKAVAHEEHVSFSVQNGKINFNGESSVVYDSFRLDFLKGELDNPKINAFYLYRGDIKDVPNLPPVSSAINSEQFSEEQEEEDLPIVPRDKILSGPKAEDPYKNDETSLVLPVLVAIGCAVPVALCLWRLG